MAEANTEGSIKVRQVTRVHGTFTHKGPGEDGTYTFRFILDDGADEVVLELNDDDADQVQDMIEGAETVFYDADRQTFTFSKLMG